MKALDEIVRIIDRIAKETKTDFYTVLLHAREMGLFKVNQGIKKEAI